MAANESADWQQLLSQTQTLVSEGNHAFPRINRDLPQLQRMAELQRARTSRLRTTDNTIAATRLWAAQGLDPQRLQQDVQTLELQPLTEETQQQKQPKDVDEYLKMVQRQAILTVLADQQQETIADYEHFMDAAIEREWAKDRHQLFAKMTPTASPSMSPGPRSPASAAMSNISEKEQAYAEVVKRLNVAMAGRQGSYDSAKDFGGVCAKYEGPRAGQAGGMTACWRMVADILTETRVVEGGREDAMAKLRACLIGARKHLEKGHEEYMRRTVTAHKEVAARGGDLDWLREVQAFLAVKLQGKGPLDFQQSGGHDTAWIQVYFCLRNGWHAAARQAAQSAPDTLPRGADTLLRNSLNDWLNTGGTVSERSVSAIDQLLKTMKVSAGAALPPKYPYVVLLCALMAKDNQQVDLLLKNFPGLVFPTIEDFMWFKLAIVTPQGHSAASSSTTIPIIPPYTVGDLQAEINRWPPTYYSKNGKEPLLYATVLILTLQFRKALDFLWKSDKLKTDAVHLAIALHHCGVLGLAPGDGTVAPDSMIQQYGARFLHVDGEIALHYYMLAAAAAGGDIMVKGRYLRQVLTESPSYGTLLGGGGAVGAHSVLSVFVPDANEQRRLLEAVAHECKRGAQTDQAVELYMAAGRPQHALATINAALATALLDAGRGSTARGEETVGRLLQRGQDAVDAIGEGGDDEGVRAVDGFRQLQRIREVLTASRRGAHREAVQALQSLNFLPEDKRAVLRCTQMATELAQPVSQLLPDILEAAVNSLHELVRQGTEVGRAAMREQLTALRSYANNIPFRVSQAVYESIVRATDTL